MNKKIYKDDLRLFWLIDDEIIPLGRDVRITEMSTEFGNGRSFIELEISSAAKKFIVQFQRGKIEVRHSMVAEDSPFSGELFCVFQDLNPSWNRLDGLMDWIEPKEEVKFFVRANCIILWPHLKEEIDEYKIWQEEQRKNEDAEETDLSDV